MKTWWIQFGCFLTGYNYDIVRNSSEVAAKMVKRYTAALLIVGILWCFIGYCFTDRYIHGGTFMSVIGALIFVMVFPHSDGENTPEGQSYWIRVTSVSN